MKKILIAVLLCMMAITLSSCRQSEMVRYNLKRQADDFNVRRRITVLNTRTDTPMMQITGLISIDTDSDGDLNITIEKAPNEFVLNYAHLSQDTTYMVEQIETLATNMARHGMPVQEVAAILGHEKIDTTMKYVVLNKDDIKSSYRRFA